MKAQKKSKIKGKRINNETLSVADLSLGEEDSDEVTKKKGRWKTSPRYDMYNKSQRAQRRRGFRREYRLYWENLSKLKRLYPSAESENPDEKLSDRFYRGLKVEGVKTKTWEYTSIRDCCHSYSTEFQEERRKRQEILKRAYADENTAEILQRLGRRLARKKQLDRNKTQSHDKLLEIVKEELMKRITGNVTKRQVVRSVRKRKRSASMQMGPDQSPASKSGDSNVTEIQQESFETALKRAEAGEDDIPKGRPKFIYTTRKEEKDFSREKRRRKKLLQKRPKYADRSSGSLEFILLQKELKKNGEDFSYLSVSITVEGTTDDKTISENPKSGYYITKPIGPTLNDEDALLKILKEKSEENKLGQNIGKNLDAGDYTNNENDKGIGDSTKNVDDTKISYYTQLSTKQTKKRGRPPKKQTNSTNVKGKQKKATPEAVNIRGKRSLDAIESRKKRKQESLSSSKFSREPISESNIKRKRKTRNYQEHSKESKKTRRTKIKAAREKKITSRLRSTKKSLSESKLESESMEESSSMSRRVSENDRRYKKKTKKSKSSSENDSLYKEKKKKTERLKIKGSKENRKKVKRSSTEENESDSSATPQSYMRKERKRERVSISRENSNEESESFLPKRNVKKYKDLHKSKSTSKERTDKKYLKKKKRIHSDSETESSDTSKEQSESLSKKVGKRKLSVENRKLSKHKSSFSSTSIVDETLSSESSVSSKKKTKTKKSRNEIEKMKRELKAEQRKLRRKKRKLLKKKLKKANSTVTQFSKTTFKNKKTNRINPILLNNMDEPYTPATIVVRFTKDPRKYKKLPTRDVESIFDHKIDRYEEFIREYNFRHSCTPLGKRAIKKLEIIKEQEFHQKQANKSEHGVFCKPGFESYDSDDFENNVERKHKPWEESVDGTLTETSIKLKQIQTKKMPWDYKDEYSDEFSEDEHKKERLKRKLTSSRKGALSSNKKKNKHKEAKRKKQSASAFSIEETHEYKKRKGQVKDEESKDSSEDGRLKRSYSSQHETKKIQSIKKTKTHNTDHLNEKYQKHNNEEKKEKDIRSKSSSISSQYKIKEPDKQEIKMHTPHKPLAENSRTLKDQKIPKTLSSCIHASPENTETVPHSKHIDEKDGAMPHSAQLNDSPSDYSEDYSVVLSEEPDKPDESASKLRREYWKMHEVRETHKPTRKGISVEKILDTDRTNAKAITLMAADGIQNTDRNKQSHKLKVLKRDKRTPQEITDANVINMNPLLLMTGLSAEITKKKRRKTTWFRRGKTPWQSQEITSTTLAPLVKRLRKKLEKIQSNTNRFVVNRVKNYTSVLEAKGLWHLWVGPNSTYTTPTPAIRREIHLDFTVYEVTDEEVYNQMAAKLIRDRGIPNKRKSQFRHSRQFFELLMSTTPDPAYLVIPKEMDTYWKQKEDLDLFLYRGQRDGRNRPGTIKYQKQMAAGKRWRMMAAQKSVKMTAMDENGITRRSRGRGENEERGRMEGRKERRKIKSGEESDKVKRRGERDKKDRT